MNKKTIYIILGGILVAVLVGLAWWWFFNRTASTPAATQNGSFGTAQNTTSSNSVGSGTQTNVANAVPEVGGASSEAQTNQGTLSYASKTVYDPTTGVVTILPSSGATVTISPAIQTTSTSGGSASGAIWLSGSPAGTDTNTAAVGSTGTTVGNVNNTSPTIASVAAKGTVFSPTTDDQSNTSLAKGV